MRRGAGSGGGAIDSTLAISNLTLTLASALQGDGNGSIDVKGSIRFADAGGELSTSRLTDPQGQGIA